MPEGHEGLSEGPEGLPEGPEGLPEGLDGLPEGPEGLPEGSEGLPEGPESLPRAQGETYIRMYRRTEFLPSLQGFVPCQGRCPKTAGVRTTRSTTGLKDCVIAMGIGPVRDMLDQ